MIDQQKFSTAWKHLCKRFSREPDPAEAAMYREWLSERMDTDEFLDAAREVWARREFFPRPADFLEAAYGDKKQVAQRDWELCQRVMSGELGALGRMSEAGQKTVALMGGPDRLRMTPVDEVHFRRQEFLRLHSDAFDIHERERQHRIGPSTEGERRLLSETVPQLMEGRSE